MPDAKHKMLAIMLLFFLAMIFVHSELGTPQNETPETHRQHDFCRLVQQTQLVKSGLGHVSVSLHSCVQPLLSPVVQHSMFSRMIADFSQNLFRANNSSLALFAALLI